MSIHSYAVPELPHGTVAGPALCAYPPRQAEGLRLAYENLVAPIRSRDVPIGNPPPLAGYPWACHRSL